MSSMNLTDIRELYRNSGDYIDREVTVGGWVRSIRDSKAFGFIVLNDGTFFEPLQVVYHACEFRDGVQTECGVCHRGQR